MKKTCSLCKEERNLGEFSRDKSKKDGRSPQCKGCRRQYRKDNKEQLAAKALIYKARPESRYRAYKYSAQHRVYDWKLTFKQFMKFWKVPCTWCGAVPEAHLNIGLDRVDPSLPYQDGNIEPCCKHCNRMKSDLTAASFKAHILKIVKHITGDNK